MTEEISALKKFALILNKENIEYFLSGSMALSFYITPRMTRDLDIVIKLKYSEVNRFLGVIKHDFLVDEISFLESYKKNFMVNIFEENSFFKIDLIFSKNSDYENIVFSRIKKFFLDEIEVNVISVEDLIIAKLDWAKDSYSEMQLNDVRNLMSLKYDEAYLNLWIEKNNLKKIYNKI